MSHDIIDNSSIKLVNVLKEKLLVSRRAKFAIGWLFLNGFRELKDEIENLEKLEIIAGTRTNRQTAEAMLLEKRWEKAVSDTLERMKYLSEDERQKILDEEFRGLVNDLSYIEPTKENIEFLQWFLEKLREGKIEIRIYYKEPLHAKIYLFEYKDQRHGLGEAIVGSSNFSVSGFSLNTELNVRVLGDDNYKKLSEWFDTRWKESEKSEFTTLAGMAIEKSWAFTTEATPFRIYLKVLHEIFSYKEEEPVIDLETELYRFQKDAVIDAYKRLKRFGGVFVSDVPGLGKTYIGSALLSHLESEGKTAIVIVPPRLMEYWKEILSEFGVARAKVFSSGKLSEILDSEKYLKRKVVLVDESHHFRNPDTQRYQDLVEICEGKEVILLSATPQNLSIWDIYWQLKLFTPYEANHNFRTCPIELKEYFKCCANGKANIEDLISEIFVRRTRSDIRENYPDEKIYFPKREGPFRIDYSIDKVYKGGLYEKIRELILRLTYARYNLGIYVKPGEFDPDELQRLKVAWENLQRLVRMNLYRRLESSVQALKDTLQNHIRTIGYFYKILVEENKIFVGDIEDIEKAIELLKNEDIEEINFEEGIEDKFYDANKFYVERLKKDLKLDESTFNEMYNLVKDILPEDDEKLQRLIEILNEDRVKGKKIIIFSAFESTVRYIYDNLKPKFEKVDFVYGGKELLTKIKRFAPKANKAKIKPEEEIKIFVATEVLSEGLNLQDGEVVINYELHWNPVRIIQRIGRIDRIGSENDKIYVYNFFPEIEAEAEIGIESKVNRRIDEIIKNFGYDEKTIRLDEPTVRKKLFEIYTERPEGIEEVEERSTAKYFESEFQKLLKNFPEEYKKAIELPALVNVARSHKEKNIVVFCRADDYYRLRMINLNGEVINSDDWDILKVLQCKPGEKGEKFNQDYFEIIEKVKNEFEVEANKRERDKENIIDPVKKEFGRLIDWLKRKESKEIKARFDKLFDFVNEKQLNYAQGKFLRGLVRVYKKKFGLKKIEILEKLEGEIHKELEDALNAVKPEIKQKYAQVIIAEELR